MIHLMVPAVALFLFSQADARGAAISDLTWLSGSWVSREGERWTEEWWTPPKGGLMMGAGISGRGDKALWFEHMRILVGPDGVLAFHAQPGGAPAVRFPLVRGGKNEAVFENAANDFPQRISYRLADGKLMATVSLIDGSKAQSWRFESRAD